MICENVMHVLMYLLYVCVAVHCTGTRASRAWAVNILLKNNSAKSRGTS